MFFREEGLIPPSATRAINDLKGRFDDELAELLAQGVASGEFRLDDVRAATLAIGGMISWVYIWYRPQGRLSADEVARHMAGYALRVAGAPAPAP